MPLFELFRLAEGKLETIQEKSTSCSIQSSSLPENEFAELVWENGHVAMQGQCGGSTSSNRARKGTSSSLNNLDFRSLGSESNLKAGKIGSLNCELKEFPASVPSGEIGVDQNDDMVPWLNHYSMPGSLQSDYNSYFLADLPVLGVNEPASMRNNVGSQDKGSRAQAYRDPLSSSTTTAAGTSTSTTATAATTTTTSTRLSPIPFPSQTSFPSYRSRAVGSTATSTSSNMALHSFSGDSPQLMGASSNNSTGLVNFACFSRPAALAKGITESSGKAAGLGLERAIIKEGGVCNIKDHNPCGANLVVDLTRSDVKPNEEIVCAGRSEAEKLANRTVGTNAPVDGEKKLEAVGGSSSVCSRNSVEGSLDDTKHNLKRKFFETEDSEDNSADMEDELVSTKKQVPPRGTSARRSRAAEVHNLSERRRRDRINEKMRALQELIPNCNKVDKASMLDEVIEYLKTLQLQLQMMTTGASLYMPPAMLPTGMQHMHPAHMVHFPNIGMGMGTGVGFGGMGMVDMNMQGAHFPHPLVSGTPALQSAMAVPNFQMYGLPNQGLPMLVPRPPFGPSPAGPRMTKATGLSNANEMLGPGETGDHCPAASTNESIQNVKKQSVQNTGSRCLTRQM